MGRLLDGMGSSQKSWEKSPSTKTTITSAIAVERADMTTAIPSQATLGNTVLLVVDVINSCAAEEYQDPARSITYNKIRQMVPTLASFIGSFKQLGGQVVLTTTVPWREPYLPDNINELYRHDENARYWSTDTSGHAEQFYGIPTEGATIVAKNSYDAFTNPDLIGALQQMRTRYIVVAGIFGDGCVLATICGAFSRGYQLIIARDLIETTDDEGRQAVLRHLKQRMWPLMYGTTVTSHEILTAFSK